MDQNLCHKKLEESRKKLTEISKQLNDVNRVDGGHGETQWCCLDQIVSSIEELQALISWIAEKRGAPEESSVILQKLQQLSNIRKVLEKSALESQQYLCHFKKGSYSGSELDYHNVFTDTKDVVSKSISYLEASVSEPLKTCNNSYVTSSGGEKIFPPIEEYTKSFDAESISLYLKKLCSLPRPLMSQSMGDLGRETDDQHDSLGTAISEDEGLGEESRRGDSTGPSSLLEINDPTADAVDSIPSVTVRYKEPSSPTSNRRDQVGWTRESCCQRNSIELCLATITKLKESLHAKENEILKLKNSSQDENNMKELQMVVNNLQQKINQLQSSAFLLEKENATLKENLLELEEAENDARLQGQRLEEKLIFLQQKDSHFQAEFAETKHALKLCLEELSLKDAEERELHSQLKFMEVLVQKYEEQLKHLEREPSSQQKSNAEKLDLERHKETFVQKGTQTYFSQESTGLKNRHKKSDFSCSENMTKEASVQVENSFVTNRNDGITCGVQTDPLPKRTSVEELSSLICLGCEVTNNSCEGHGEEHDLSSSSTCPVQKELLKRLRHLVEEDANLQQQLHHVDQINLDLWQKLHSLQFHIGECQKEQVSEEGIRSSDESTIETFCSGGLDTDNVNLNKVESKKCTNLGIFNSFDCSEEKLKERLSQLEKINSSFLKKLEMREKLYLEQERRHESWLRMEDQLTTELKTLGAERDSLFSQVTQLEAEKVNLSAKVKMLETELSVAREKHQQETLKITAERDEIMADLQKTIDELTMREKEYLKQIAKLKSSKNKANDKTEFESLKSSYVQLQIELVGYRDKMETMKNDFDGQLDSLKESHSVEENRLLDELGVFREKDLDCENKLNSSQTRQMELENALTAKEEALEQARIEFKKHMQIAEEEHKSVEAELRKKLNEMEEGTAFATKALKEERFRLERELQENIDDLRSKEELYKARIMELESNVSQLHQELHRLTGNLHTKFDGDGTHNETMNFHREHLLNELQELRVREGELREKLDEMEKKEAAYRETLEHADRIVASVERGYKNKIEELEMSERGLKQRVGYLEEVENRLRFALQRERRSSDGRKPDDLVLELSEAEKRENSLKEKISTLELLHRSASQRVRELEKAQQQLESQVNDREELAASLEKLQSEQESMRKELTRLKKSENSLQLTLHQTEGLLEARVSEMNSEMERFASEKRELEETISQLRCQVRDLEEKSEKHLVEEEPEGEPLSKNLPFSIIQPSMQKSPTGYNAKISEVTEAKIPNCDIQMGISRAEETYTPPPVNPIQEALADIQPVTGSLKCEKTGSVVRDATGNFPTETKRTPSEKAVEQPRQSSNNPTDDRGATGATKAEKEYCEVRMQLEECMMRAMDAMKMEMEHKAGSYSPENNENGRSKDMFLPPFNFRVVQQVGSDTLLVGWEYVDVPNLEGFELYVNEQLHETVYAPDRRKAVISGLDLSKPLTLSICSVSTSGQISEPQSLHISQKASDGFFFEDDDDDDDDELFDDDIPEKQLRPYSMEW